MIVWRSILDLPMPHVAHAFLFEGRVQLRPLCSFGRKHGFKMVPCERPAGVLGACMACFRHATRSAAVQAVPAPAAKVGASKVKIDERSTARLIER